MSAELLRDLARAKAVFQLRAIEAIITAQAIDAQRAETTKIGSVEDESAVPTGCAHTSPPKGNTL